MQHFRTLNTVIASLLGIFFLRPAVAEDLTIVDVQGTAQHVAEIDSTGNVQFSLVDSVGRPAQGIEVSLRNTLTEEILTTTVQDGVALFESIPPGTWEVASSANWATFTQVGVTEVAAIASAGGVTAGGIGVGSLATGAAAIGGGAVAVNEVRDDSSSSKGKTAPQPTPTPLPPVGSDGPPTNGSDSRPMSPAQ